MTGIIFTDKLGPRAFNRLAREQMRHRLLADILADMQVCELEGWDKLEYLNELREMLDSLGKRGGNDMEITIKASPKEIAELLVEIEAQLKKTNHLPQNLSGGVVALDSSVVQQLIKDSAARYAELNELMNRQGEFRRE